MNKILENFKEYSALIPLLGAYFIVYGTIDLITYYNEFSIPIMSFIDFSEIISFFLNNIYAILMHVSLLLVMSLLWDKYLTWQYGKTIDQLSKEIDENDIGIRQLAEKVSNKRDDADSTGKEIDQLEKELNNLKNKREESRLKIKSIRRKLRNQLVLFAILMLITFIIGLIGGKVRLILATFSPIIITTLIMWAYKSSKGFIPIYLLTSLLSSSYSRAIQKAESVKHGKDLMANITFNSAISPLDSNSVYVGKTTNYAFLYDTLQHSTLIISVSSIQSIEFTEANNNE